MASLWDHLINPWAYELPLPPAGIPISVQGMFYVPDPNLKVNVASDAPFFAVNSTITLQNEIPVWTLDRTGELNWRQSDLLRGCFNGSTAFQFWLNWSAGVYGIHRFYTSPEDIDFNWFPLWIPEEYPMERFPFRDQVPVLIQGSAQPLVEKLSYLWATQWWQHRSHRSRIEKALENSHKLMRLTDKSGGVGNIPFLKEKWSCSSENLVVGQVGRYKLSYYGYTGTERCDVCEIQFCPMDTLNTTNLRSPGKSPSQAQWIELVMPDGRHLPVDTPYNMAKSWYKQMSRVITNRFNPGSGDNERRDDNMKLERKQRKIKLMMRWRRDILNAVQAPWVQELLMEPNYVKLLRKLAGQPLLSLNPEDLEKVSSSWVQEWFSEQ